MKELKNAFLEDDILVQVEALSTMLEVSKMSITNYVKDGMPFINIADSKHKHFPVRKCIEWLVLKGLLEIKQPIKERTEDESFDDMDSQEARRRQDIAKAKLMEMEVEEAEGKLIRVEEAQQELSRAVLAIRSKVLSMANNLSPVIFIQDTQQEVFATIENACYEALSDLSRLE